MGCFIRCVGPSFVLPSCPQWDEHWLLVAEHTVGVLLCPVHQCPTLPVHPTNMVPIRNVVQGLHVKNLMGEQSDTLARPKRLSGH